MSASPSPSPSPSPTRPDRSLPLLLAAAGLVVAIVAAVLVFGVARPPALEPLTDHLADAPSEPLAWSGWRDGDHCLDVAWPEGTATQPFCDESTSELLGWIDDDTVLLAGWEPDSRAIEVDVRDGTIVGNRPRPPSSDDRSDRRSLTVTTEGDRLLVLGEDGTELWRVPAPTTYTVEWSTVAPDGRHAAFGDSAERLLVVPTDGSAPPRVWAEDVGGWPEAAWGSERVAGN